MPDKLCSKCNKSFDCTSPKEGCWCESMIIDLETLVKLRAEYDNCLCNKCLIQYSSQTL